MIVSNIENVNNTCLIIITVFIIWFVLKSNHSTKNNEHDNIATMNKSTEMEQAKTNVNCITNVVSKDVATNADVVSTDVKRGIIYPPANEIGISELESKIIRINRSSMEDIYGSREFRQIDRRVNEDQLTEPVQRYPSNYYPKPPLVRSINIATRGIPDSFSFIGNLHREYDNKILKLYGRRRYDELWDYYVVFNSHDNLETKINLPTRNYRQLFDGDDIDVDMLKHGGKFKVFLNKQDEFTYSPYVMY